MKRYSFLAMYPIFEDTERSLRLGHDYALEEWRSAVARGKIPSLTTPQAVFTVRFTPYSFNEYPYKELIKNWVFNNFKNHRGDLCYRGKKYWDVEDLIAMLNLHNMLMELTVEVEE